MLLQQATCRAVSPVTHAVHTTHLTDQHTYRLDTLRITLTNTLHTSLTNTLHTSLTNTYTDHTHYTSHWPTHIQITHYTSHWPTHIYITHTTHITDQHTYRLDTLHISLATHIQITHTTHHTGQHTYRLHTLHITVANTHTDYTHYTYHWPHTYRLHTLHITLANTHTDYTHYTSHWPTHIQIRHTTHLTGQHTYRLDTLHISLATHIQITHITHLTGQHIYRLRTLHISLANTHTDYTCYTSHWPINTQITHTTLTHFTGQQSMTISKVKHLPSSLDKMLWGDLEGYEIPLEFLLLTSLAAILEPRVLYIESVIFCWPSDCAVPWDLWQQRTRVCKSNGHWVSVSDCTKFFLPECHGAILSQIQQRYVGRNVITKKSHYFNNSYFFGINGINRNPVISTNPFTLLMSEVEKWQTICGVKQWNEPTDTYMELSSSSDWMSSIMAGLRCHGNM